MNDQLFSYFKAPVKNRKPYTTVTLRQVYNVIVGDYFKRQTERLRSLNEKSAKEYKIYRLDFVTFSGIFSTRRIEGLKKHTGLICLDFDHLGKSLNEFRKKLIEDQVLPPELVFTSPSGTGLKLVLQIDLNEAPHKTWFIALSNYYKANYSLDADNSGSDVSRACFLCHDPNAYINPKYLES
jgi:hypothetical protein